MTQLSIGSAVWLCACPAPDQKWLATGMPWLSAVGVSLYLQTLFRQML